MSDFAVTRPDVAMAGADEDARLLDAATKRDAGAFTALVSRHYAIVYRIVWRMMNGHADAEDVTQEAFLRLWNDPSQLREAGAVRSWLIRVAGNLAKDRYRSHAMRGSEAMEELADNRESAATLMVKNEAMSRVDHAIALLPERQRLALTLLHLENLGQRTAAEVMEISVDALESLVARARRSLKDALAGEWSEIREGLLD